MITATAPGRCGLVGDPTDFFGGSVLSCSIRERARCTLDPDASGIVLTVLGQRRTIHSVGDLALGESRPLNIACAVLAALEVSPGQTPPFHLRAETDIPMQADLAGSTALLATITGCLLTHLQLRLSPYEIAELIRKIENDLLGVVCGFHDHYMTVFGGLNFIDFRDKDSSVPQDPTRPFATVEPLDRFVSGLPLIIALAGDAHALLDPLPPVRERVPAGGRVAAEGYREIARLARSAKSALLACDWASLADVMNRSQAVQCELAGRDGTDEFLTAAALAGGADAARRTGMGGATVLALTHDPARTGQALLAVGADTILYPHPSPGLTVSVGVTVP